MKGDGRTDVFYQAHITIAYYYGILQQDTIYLQLSKRV